MRRLIESATALTLLLSLGCAPRAQLASAPEATELLGTWTVDLRPTPDAEAYYQEFVVTAVDGKRFTGTFYGTAIENARVNTDWGQLHFAFTTADGSGAYNTSGVLVDGKLQGRTHSLGREFLAVWTAEKQASPGR